MAVSVFNDLIRKLAYSRLNIIKTDLTVTINSAVKQKFHCKEYSYVSWILILIL